MGNPLVRVQGNWLKGIANKTIKNKYEFVSLWEYIQSLTNSIPIFAVGYKQDQVAKL